MNALHALTAQERLTNAAGTVVSAGTVSTGVGYYFDILPVILGGVATVIGIALSIVMIINSMRKDKREVKREERKNLEELIKEKRKQKQHEIDYELSEIAKEKAAKELKLVKLQLEEFLK